MTVYEHAMIGIDGALALNLQRCWGWPIVALAGLAAVLPDLDGLAILFGFQCYAEGHRLWGHNLLAAGIAAAIVSAAAYGTNVFPKLRKRLAKHCTAFAEGQDMPHTSHPRQTADILAWIAVGITAAYSHLLADVIFSAGKNLPVWGVPLYWPFSNAASSYPLLPWGDVGVTLIFAAGMFAMLGWPKRSQPIAIASLAFAAGYIALRGFLL
jgi:membrane-bound metal-dependent hydrolase YbcI (DUF457 family)